MNLGDAIKKSKELRPSQYSDETMAGWVSELDGLIYRDIMATHEDAPDDPGQYDVADDEDTQLLAEFPYDGMYVQYIIAKIEWYNAEYERYNNDLVAFNTMFQRYSAAYNREHMPLQPNSLSFWGTYETSTLPEPLES